MLSHSHDVSGLRLVVKGKAECKWADSSGGSTSAKYYFGKEKYLESVNFLFGSENGIPTDVPVGVHIYNYECLLPEEIPASVEGLIGFVRYKVQATLDVPWDLDLHSVKQFTVVRHDDLNLVTFPNYRQPCEVEEIKTFCCLCCESDPLIMIMRVPKTGFGLGETIPVHVELINKSTTNIISTEFQLRKVEEYISNVPETKSRMCSEKITSKTSRGVAPLQIKKLDETLLIPSMLCTSNDRFCSVVKIKYCVRLKAYPEGLNKAVDMDIMIAIGNVGIVDETTSPVLSSQLASATPANADITASGDLRESIICKPNVSQ